MILNGSWSCYTLKCLKLIGEYKFVNENPISTFVFEIVKKNIEKSTNFDFYVF